jgi:ACS family hexuronate transporter-like MFS transporter
VTGRYRWWIGALLFASTVINYLDRQTLSVLAPHLKADFHWTNQDFAWIVIAFRLSYTVMQAVSGRLLDRFGTRKGLTLAVLWYSAIAMLTSCANGFGSFCGLRFLLGAGEAANWPAATKAVSEWFPTRERGFAVALFDSGSSVGAALATVIVPFLYLRFGSWRPAFLVTGLLGFIWVLFWRRHYHPPESHPRISAEERRTILADRQHEGAELQIHETVASATLLRLSQTWGAIASRGLTDPVWYMITDWFAIYLVSKGFNLEETAVGFWVPFLAADLGNFAGGGVSSWLIRRGWSVGRARRTLIVAGGFGVLALVPAAFLSEITTLIACFAIATFSYAVMSTMALSLPADMFESRAVGSVAGLSGAASGAGTLLSTYLIGVVADRSSFKPILITASVVPLAAAVLVMALVRNSEQSGRGLLKAI